MASTATATGAPPTASHRSCWRSSPRARRKRTTNEAAPTGMARPVITKATPRATGSHSAKARTASGPSTDDTSPTTAATAMPLAHQRQRGEGSDPVGVRWPASIMATRNVAIRAEPDRQDTACRTRADDHIVVHGSAPENARILSVDGSPVPAGPPDQDRGAAIAGRRYEHPALGLGQSVPPCGARAGGDNLAPAAARIGTLRGPARVRRLDVGIRRLRSCGSGRWISDVASLPTSRPGHRKRSDHSGGGCLAGGWITDPSIRAGPRLDRVWGVRGSSWKAEERQRAGRITTDVAQPGSDPGLSSLP